MEEKEITITETQKPKMSMPKVPENYEIQYSEKFGNTTKIATIIMLAIITLDYVLVFAHASEAWKDIALLLSLVIYIFPLVFSWAGLISFLGIKETTIVLKKYKRSIARLNNSGMAMLLFSGFSFFCDLWFLYSAEYSSQEAEIGFLIKITVLFAVSVGFGLLQRKRNSYVIGI